MTRSTTTSVPRCPVGVETVAPYEPDAFDVARSYLIQFREAPCAHSFEIPLTVLEAPAGRARAGHGK